MIRPPLRRIAFLLLLSAALLARPADAQMCGEQEVFAAGSQTLGWSAALDGPVAIFGAPDDDSLSSGTGFAAVFRRDAATGDWNEEQILLASNGVPLDRFGSSVAVSGGVAIVGADRHDLTGSAYVFRYSPASGTWVEEQELVPVAGEPGDWFGCAAAISGDVAIVGARLAGSSGSASIFRYQPASASWDLEQVISVPFSQASFGASVAIEGDVALVGAPGESAAFVFRRSPTSGLWLEEAILEPPLGTGSVFGLGVALSADLALVGGGTSLARIFRRDPVTSVWQPEQTLTDPEWEDDPYVGLGLAIEGDLAVVGNPFDVLQPSGAFGPGLARVYRFDAAPGVWVAEITLVSATAWGIDAFGISVDIDGTTIAVGGAGDSTASLFAGAGHLFDLSLCLPTPEFRRGDGNGDGRTDLADPVFTIQHLFGGVPATCFDALDSNDDGAVDLADALHGLVHQFAGGPAPAPPVTVCGPDPTPDTLGGTCSAYPCP